MEKTVDNICETRNNNKGTKYNALNITFFPYRIISVSHSNPTKTDIEYINNILLNSNNSDVPEYIMSGAAKNSR